MLPNVEPAFGMCSHAKRLPAAVIFFPHVAGCMYCVVRIETEEDRSLMLGVAVAFEAIMYVVVTAAQTRQLLNARVRPLAHGRGGKK